MVARNQLGYRWHLRVSMAQAGMFVTSDLQPLLAGRGISLSDPMAFGRHER